MLILTLKIFFIYIHDNTYRKQLKEIVFFYFLNLLQTLQKIFSIENILTIIWVGQRDFYSASFVGFPLITQKQ